MDQTIRTNYKSLETRGITRKPLVAVTTPGTLIILFFIAHIILAWVILKFSWVATIQLAVVVSCGLWWALVNPRLDRLAMVGGYIAGGEVLWRMTQTTPFWEFGKFSIICLFILALIKTGRLWGPWPAFLFFGCLLPSIVLPMANVSLTQMRDDLSFYLSGPLALMVSAWFFSHVKLNGEAMQRLYYAVLSPTITVATIALLGILAAEKLRFSNNSNFIASGGFGPNQVSATLGLGILVAFLAYHHRSLKQVLKVTLLSIMLFLIVQCALTFSRSGLYLASGGIVLASYFLVRDRRYFVQVAMGVSILLLVIIFILLPRLENFTGGQLTERFRNTRLTTRNQIAESDFNVFAENPVFGVGPGQARFYRNNLPNNENVASHTEFSRLLAEHGIFGFVAIIFLIIMGVQHFREKRSVTGKAMALSMICWSVLFMLVSAMRLAAPAFAFGLTAATVLPDSGNDIKK